MTRRAVLRLALLFTLALAVVGCTRGTARLATGALGAAVAVAHVATVAAILHHHDAHYHGWGCGHHYRYRDGRYVYWYGGHWEYYDYDSGYWYAY